MKPLLRAIAYPVIWATQGAVLLAFLPVALFFWAFDTENEQTLLEHIGELFK